MKFLGVKIKKMYCEKMLDNFKEIRINSSVDIVNIREIKLSEFKTKDQLISVEFKHILDYSPNYAKLELNGEILLEEETKVIKEIISQWKDKKVPSEFKINFFNLIIQKTTIKMLELEETLGLPFHIQFPLLKSSTKEEEK